MSDNIPDKPNITPLVFSERIMVELAKLDTGEMPPLIRELTYSEKYFAELKDHYFDHEPGDNKPKVRAKQRVVLPPRSPLQDQLAAVLARDVSLAEQYRETEGQQLARALTQKEAERAAAQIKADAMVARARQEADETDKRLMSERERWLENTPKHTFWTALGALFVYNTRQASIVAYNQAHADWLHKFAREHSDIGPMLARATHDAYHDVRHADFAIGNLNKQIERLHIGIDSWLEEGKEWASELSTHAKTLDERELYGAVQAQLNNRESLTESAWTFYMRDSRIVGDVVGFDEARALGPTAGERQQKMAARQGAQKLLANLAEQMPDNIWELEQAKKRFKKAASDFGGRGGRKRSISDDIPSSEELREEALKEMLREEAKKKKEAEKEEAANQERWRMLIIQEWLIAEMNRRSERMEAELAADPTRGRRLERRRDRGMGRGM